MITTKSFEEKAAGYLERGELQIVQVNMGNLCNQDCLHCHVGGSPRGTRNMDFKTAETIISFLRNNPGLTLDITGGAPELNPNFRHLVMAAMPFAGSIMVRSNLTVMLEPGQEDLPGFLADHRVKIIASLPCYTKVNVDGQRGTGTFEKSIRVLRILNRSGYGRKNGLIIDLVYNPGGGFLPGEQKELEMAYKDKLKSDFGITFNNLLTITNAPIGRFGRQLKEENKLNDYLDLLDENFNRLTLPNIMCRSLISVDYRGVIYDCDFNQVLGLGLKDKEGHPIPISSISAKKLVGQKILTDTHCFSCTAGSGSSCGGALT
ncbi:MAG TPA: radical SAM/Cys-rich domain protein [Proteobacteria bacterium]|nr:radical SAM/Cys-rich domain protein [Pseudomonadota bacterium]